MRKILILLLLLAGLGFYRCTPKESEVLGAPIDPKATEVTGSSAKLTWGAVSGAEGYEVKIGGQEDTAQVSDAFYDVTSLDPATRYSWQVRAVRGDEASEWVEGEKFTTEPAATAPAPPTGLVAKDVTHNSATLSWTASADATDGYEVQLNDGTPIEVEGTSYAAANLSVGTDYTWKVRAVNGKDVSEWVEGPDFTTESDMVRFISVSDGFYGDMFENGTHNTWLQFSEFDPKWTLIDINGWGISIDLISEQMDMSQPILDIPAGTYTVSSTYKANTISPDATFGRIYSGGYVSEYWLQGEVSGSVTIEGDHTAYKMMFDLVFDGITKAELHAIYEGPLAIDNPESYSTFRSDQHLGTIPIDGGVGHVSDLTFDGFDYPVDVYLGGGFSSGVYTEYDEMLDTNVFMGNGWILGNVQISTEVGSDGVLPDGVYTIADSFEPGYAFAGYFNDLEMTLYGLWVRRMENDEVADVAPIVSGTVTSTFSGGEYKWVVNGKDDVGNTITGTLVGPHKPAPSAAPSAYVPALSKISQKREAFRVWNPFALGKGLKPCRR